MLYILAETSQVLPRAISFIGAEGQLLSFPKVAHYHPEISHGTELSLSEYPMAPYYHSSHLDSSRAVHLQHTCYPATFALGISLRGQNLPSFLHMGIHINSLFVCWFCVYSMSHQHLFIFV